MTIIIMIISVLFACLCVLVPGWGAMQILMARGFRFRSDALSMALSSFAFGVHVNALLFLFCWVLVSPEHPLLLASILIAINACITGAGWYFARGSRIALDLPMLVMMATGISIGLFAVFRFPSSLDSVQVLQVQNYLLGRAGGQLMTEGAISRVSSFLFGGLEVPTQSGFAGLMLIPSLLQTDMPVATVAAGGKVLLLTLAALVSLYAARQFKIKFVLLGAALILSNMIFSKFGLYGLFATGKDSIFAMIMALASLSAVIDADDDANEPGLYLSAAILLGAIAVPYLMVFWALYFVLSGGKVLRQAGRLAAWGIYPLILGVIGVRAAFAEPGAIHLGLLPALVIGVLLVWLVNLAALRWKGYAIEFSRWAWIALALLPSLCLLGIWIAMPVTGKIIMGYDETGPITQAFAPLDGKMSAWDFLLSMYPTNNPWISVGAVILSGVAPLLSARFRTPFYLALFTFVPAATLFAVLNVKFNIPLLPHFNLWDITRDAVQWCLGVFGIILVQSGVRAVMDRWNLLNVQPVIVTATVFVVGFWASLGEYRSALGRAPVITASGGFADPNSAAAMDYTWRAGRNSVVYVSKDSDFALDFYSYQMFGPAQLQYFDRSQLSSSSAPEQLFFASSGDLRLILEAATEGGSSGYVKFVSENGYIIKLANDGKAELDTSALPPVVAKLEGAYAVEVAGDKRFRWVPQRTELILMSLGNPNRELCSILGFINGRAEEKLRVHLKGNALDLEVEVPPSADFAAPAEVEICVSGGADGVAKLELTANTPARQFPGDAREIAYGIVWPIR